MSGDEGFIPMQVSALAVDPVTNVPVVILADPVGGTTLPVGIGLGEAPAIAAELDGIELERPMTHQLTAALLDAAGARIVRVELRDSVRAKMSAAIVLERAGGQVAERVARPSDAIALALHVGAPIAVAVSVLDRAARETPSWGSGIDGDDDFLFGDAFDDSTDPALLERLGDEAFGKWKM
ncbi:MAG TPA: bifunctional nuclease family protein [Kofleriaceae bacterium]